MKSYLCLMLLAIAISGCESKTTTPVANAVSQPEIYVMYEMEGVPIRYYLMSNGLICPGTIRDGQHIVWDDAKPLTKSEYMYGGPHIRSPLIQLKDIKYQSEQTPNGLKRITIPKD